MTLVKRFMEDAERGGMHILAAQVRMNGEIVDEWTRFPAKPRFETYSVSKTFAGVGAGIALEEGLITLDERISESFPEASYDITDENALSITVRDLLTMTSGLSETMLWRDGYERKYERDWIRFFYKAGKFVNKPGTAFLYNNVNPYILGCLIEKKSGQNLREYLRYRLFEPVGIHNVEWTSCPMGHTIAANALQINVDELGQFGQMLANGGEYNGKRIVSESYIKAMMTSYSETGEYIPSQPPVRAGYGYQTWIDGVNHAAYMWGIFGQYCVVLPEKNAVVTVLSLEPSDGGSNGNYDTSPLRKVIWEDLVTQV
ncbi:hypothetical protein C3B58_05385 [Lactonifactor longoviformis]|uniref:CubicO group peptidase, beta-lactamase class C family n=1 Tax=Lactonifactor longoviformis DSM 17459 TaxID=1122155 RepID=A0A1M4YZW4_9CLOT|nr:serine hydrolase [Lactonifactor longoviformis]POP33875.1 hypothetical protein C3B58_05385 [Lactonifactor longoviformis]SHF11359.1 CubicO group peptidase, beta-lactamase class C family [Lactonifactor longoviformis DSM 17459]